MAFSIATIPFQNSSKLGLISLASGLNVVPLNSGVKEYFIPTECVKSGVIPAAASFI